MNRSAFACTLLLVTWSIVTNAAQSPERPAWPDLPAVNGKVTIPAQEWPQKPGPRTVEISIHYPGGKLANVGAETGLMLNLHNWGGTFCGGAANPQALADRLDVVTICVNYLQSGRRASVEDPEPYDYGYLQALDSLRALWFAGDALNRLGKPFANDRVFATGGSGGGNVTLMANKLAPRTFTAVVPMCGMPKLGDDIAFNLPGGSRLNARWSRDPASPNYLRPAAQEIRFIGHPAHLRVMKELGNSARIFVVHGRDDRTCPFPDAAEMTANFAQAGLDVIPHFVGQDDLDGKVFTSSGHALGNRTEIPFTVAGEVLKTARRQHASDFDRRDERVRYPVTNGAFVISYRNGFPVGRFEPKAGLTRVLEPAAARLEPTRKLVYKTAGRRQLHLHVFEPENHAATDRRAAFLMIHGGGWTGGNARKFYPVADHLARRGMLAICLEYRLANARTGTTVFDCVRDGRSAVRHLRRHAAELGIDPDRIVVGGGSAGGHVAAGTALLPFDEAGEATGISCVPNALVLLNPVIDTSENGYGRNKIGERWQELSPVEHVVPGLPPTIVFHSTQDTVTPFAGARLFHERALAAGADCELVVHEGGRHGYFIFDLRLYREVMGGITAFLGKRGFVD